MNSIKTEQLNPPRNRVVDKVSFKDAFSLFLLATEGNYVLDTSIELKSEKGFIFPKYNDFKCPRRHCMEVWAMYSPPSAPEKATKMLEHYLINWENLQKIIRGNLNNPEKIYQFHTEITALIVDSVETAVGRNMDDPWTFKLDQKLATIPALPITKHYGNGHKPWHETQSNIESICKNYNGECKPEIIRLLDSLIKKSAQATLSDEINYHDMKDLQMTIYDSLAFLLKLNTLKSDLSTLNIGEGKQQNFLLNFNSRIDAAYQAMETCLKTINKEMTDGAFPEEHHYAQLKELFTKVENELSSTLAEAQLKNFERYKNTFSDIKKAKEAELETDHQYTTYHS